MGKVFFQQENGFREMPHLDSLASQLHDDRVEIRAKAAEQLCRLGAEANAFAVELTRACSDDEAVSQWAVAALEELGPPAAGSVGDLSALIADSKELVAYWATTLIGRLGSKAGSAVESLVSALQDSPHLAVQQRAAWALGKIGGRSSIASAALDQASQSSDARLAKLATQARGNFA